MATTAACREIVARDTPRALAIWVALSPRARRAVAAARLSGSMTGGAAADAALGPGGGEPSHGALVDHVAFELGECGHDGEEELPLSGGGVAAGEGSGEDPHADPALVQLVGECQDLPDRAAEAIELPHREGVAGSQVLQRGGQPGPLGLATGDLVLEELHAACRDERVALQLGVLGLGADAQVCDEVLALGRHTGECLRNRRTTASLTRML